MTFSIAAQDPDTGEFGLAAATSDLAVGARVMWGRAGVGAVLTQHTTDPRLGPRGLDLLAAGCSAPMAMSTLIKEATCAAARQLAIIDADGRAEAWAGAYVDSRAAYSRAFPGFAVLGNMLASPEVGAAIAAHFVTSPTNDLASRLVSSLAAGLAAGGEQSPPVSAAVKVYRDQDFAYVDLRIDRSEQPLEELAELNELYASQRDDYVRRALDPDVSYARDYAPDPTVDDT